MLYRFFHQMIYLLVNYRGAFLFLSSVETDFRRLATILTISAADFSSPVAQRRFPASRSLLSILIWLSQLYRRPFPTCWQFFLFRRLLFLARRFSFLDRRLLSQHRGDFFWIWRDFTWLDRVFISGTKVTVIISEVIFSACMDFFLNWLLCFRDWRQLFLARLLLFLARGRLCLAW